VFVTNITISTVLTITPEMASQGGKYAMVVGIPSLQMGVFGGLICGILAAWCYNRFHTMQLPEFLGFFQALCRHRYRVYVVYPRPDPALRLAAYPGGYRRAVRYRQRDNQAASTFIFGLTERADPARPASHLVSVILVLLR
jgi:PTS system D-glucosamine-specific IIC component